MRRTGRSLLHGSVPYPRPLTPQRLQVNAPIAHQIVHATRRLLLDLKLPVPALAVMLRLRQYRAAM
jgi:hypothetical protein